MDLNTEVKIKLKDLINLIESKNDESKNNEDKKIGRNKLNYLYPNGVKKCSVCNQIKPIHNFRMRSSQQCLRSECNDCLVNIRTNQRKKNRDKRNS